MSPKHFIQSLYSSFLNGSFASCPFLCMHIHEPKLFVMVVYIHIVHVRHVLNPRLCKV